MNKIIIQALSFFGISGIGWLMDMVIYTVLTSLSVPVIIANTISSGVAVTFVYLVSTKKLFTNISASLDLKKKYVIYIVYQIVMILLSSFIISKIALFLGNVNVQLFEDYSEILSKIIFTPVTMIVNFIFMKFLIERLK